MTRVHSVTLYSLVATVGRCSPRTWNIRTSLSLVDEIWMEGGWRGGRNGVGTKTGRVSELNKRYGIICT